MIRNNEQRADKPTLGIIDSKSVRNTEYPSEKGYDAGKKVSGIKVHAVTDIQGIPIGLHVTTANIQDRAGALQLINNNKSSLVNIKTFLVDGGYSGENFAKSVANIIDGAKVKVSKRTVKHQFELEYQRWIVERSFSWLDKNRRLWKNCERLLNTYKQMVNLVFISLILRRF